MAIRSSSELPTSVPGTARLRVFHRLMAPPGGVGIRFIAALDQAADGSWQVKKLGLERIPGAR